MSHSITVGCGFETAHRLPHMDGKCVNLHGHSWWVDATITGSSLDGDGKLIKFDRVKRPLEAWVREHLDHATMLGVDDPIVEALVDAGVKLFLFDPAATGPTEGLGWPTVENVAVLLCRVVAVFVKHLDNPAPAPLHIRVLVRETPINRAGWEMQL